MTDFQAMTISFEFCQAWHKFLLGIGTQLILYNEIFVSWLQFFQIWWDVFLRIVNLDNFANLKGNS